MCAEKRQSSIVCAVPRSRKQPVGLFQGLHYFATERHDGLGRDHRRCLLHHKQLGWMLYCVVVPHLGPNALLATYPSAYCRHLPGLRVARAGLAQIRRAAPQNLRLAADERCRE